MKDRSKRNLTIGILCCLLVFMGVGFAIMNATLNIDGTATAINTWSIVIDSITPIDNNDDKNDARSVSTNILDTKTEASFEVEFKKPGDYLEYNVVINNEGSIDGYVESIEKVLVDPRNNHIVEIKKGICEEECQNLMTNFFKSKRK